ncbi:hypothetical protein F5878DRAFT_691935 [Lentinula raphanica]|uniref:factor independent urate hydroxylase n=1 Tax=Lentinula raphanica TaxID=153919 RepID=A0AA38UAX2_9AGAR|nr:hypothetical protein F5878DRAFT_691935 [Lentinula raphanica]
MEAFNTYQTPLSSRYASKEMAHLFSPSNRFFTWRKLWLNLAIAEKELGLPISDEAIAQMKDNLHPTPDQFDIAAREEKNVDTMSWLMCIPLGRSLQLLWGLYSATSCYVTEFVDTLACRWFAWFGGSDEYTLLKEVDDRIFSTSVDLNHTFAPIHISPPKDEARTITLDVFAEDESASVQATLYKNGRQDRSRERRYPVVYLLNATQQFYWVTTGLNSASKSFPMR